MPPDRSADEIQDWRVLELTREEAGAVALWAFGEREKTPAWRWSRRRFLDRLFNAKVREGEELRDRINHVIAERVARAEQIRSDDYFGASEVPR